MKTTFKIFALATLILGLSTSSFAQSTSGAATASATLLVPISIAKTTDMNFGTVAASATAGTVVLDYANVTTVTGGVTKFAGTTSTASFTVTGEGSKAFSISYPTTVTLTGSVSGSLIVDNIVCEQGASNTLSSGTKVLNVKGILNVPANSVAGSYTNTADLKVTVNYN